jgi:aerobic carbon-monoxide dehydrogenase large subunit
VTTSVNQSAAQRFGSGKAVARVEDASLLTGKGVFTDDVSPAGMLHVLFLRSPYAHARIVSMDTAAAAAMPGVVAVFTGAQLEADGVKPLPVVANFVRPDGTPAVSPTRWPLAIDRVRYAGEAVAMVVAQTRDAAKDALEAIQVDYEDLPVVVDMDLALAPGAPIITPAAPDNISAQMHHGDKASATAAFEAAAHVVTLDLVNQRVSPASIEPRSVLAFTDAETGRLTIRMSTQMPTGMRDTLAGTVLGLPKEQVRVVVGDVGGGFGMKTGACTEDGAVAYAANKLKRPVKWIAERSEEFLTATHGRDIKTKASLALDANGKVLALRLHTLANTGAYSTGTGVAIQLLIGPWVVTSIYDIKVIDLTFTAVLTNTASTGAYRGAGRPEAIYIIERLMDEAARTLKLDPAELRRRNLIAPSQMPYKNAMAQTYDSGQFEKVLDRALELANWNDYPARHAASAAKGKLRGRGLASFLEWTGGNAFEEHVSITVSGDGYIEVVSATQAMGQGIVTSYAQLAVDIFGVPIEKVRVIQGDTDRANGFGSAGSRSIFTGGTAVKEGSQRTVDKARELAAEEMEVAAGDLEYNAGEFRIVGTDRKLDLFSLAAKQPQAQILMQSSSTVGGPTWPNGAHVCECEIDPATGEITLDTYAQVNDVGNVINPTIVIGQLEGGVVQGVGQALCEHHQYDNESGQLLTGSLMDYSLPRADIIPKFATEMDQSTPCLTNMLGVKGVGELGTIGATPATVNAVFDALVRAGVPLATVLKLQMPLTSDKIWAALKVRT